MASQRDRRARSSVRGAPSRAEGEDPRAIYHAHDWTHARAYPEAAPHVRSFVDLSQRVDSSSEPRFRQGTDSWREVDEREVDERADTRSCHSGRTRMSGVPPVLSLVNGALVLAPRSTRSTRNGKELSPRVLRQALAVEEEQSKVTSSIYWRARVCKYLQDFSITLCFAVAFLSFAAIFIEWGPVFREDLVIPAVVLMLVALSIAMTSCIGYRASRFASGWILLTYAIAQILSFALELWVASALTVETKALRQVLTQLPSPSLALTPAETIMSRLFNKRYFADVLGCFLYSQALWTFVRKSCPEGMGLNDCAGCFVYGANQCIADRVSCYADHSERSLSCPYMACRVGIVSYTLRLLDAVEISAYTFMALQRLVCIVVFVLQYKLYQLFSKRAELIRSAAAIEASADA